MNGFTKIDGVSRVATLGCLVLSIILALATFDNVMACLSFNSL